MIVCCRDTLADITKTTELATNMAWPRGRNGCGWMHIISKYMKYPVLAAPNIGAHWLLGCLLLMLLAANATAAPSIRWICSTETKPWQEMTAPPVADGTDADAVKLNPEVRFQTIDGFGGCFNELAWAALQQAGKSQRKAVLAALFDPRTGCGFSLCRLPIGANDFALDWYSDDETAGDFAMKHFSIRRDETNLIPYLKAAMKYQPKLKVWGVPWCPPSWMTTTNDYKHGCMKQDAPTLAAYALYFSKFVQAYQRAGINLYAIHPQNEPSYNNNIYPQCKWSGPEINVFLRDYLLPQLKQDQVKVEVWLGTIVSHRLEEFVDPVLGDPVTGPQITGVGYQWAGRPAFAATHQKYPDKQLLQTETECNDGANSWAQAVTTFDRISEDLNHYANGYDYWNMVLNETGKSSWNWRQNCLVTVNPQAHEIVFNPEFYALKHYSHFVPPGGHRIAVNGEVVKNISAFQTPAGKLVVVASNHGSAGSTLRLAAGGKEATFSLPPNSMNTMVLSDW